VNIGSAVGGSGSGTLVINKGGTGSDCEVQQVIIYDGHIFEEDLLEISVNLGLSSVPWGKRCSPSPDVDECAAHPCGWQADCVDHLIPDVGYDCNCKEYIGWTGLGGTDGSNCTGMSLQR
jgi:hypothetical protein